jgi:hypothetical protein
MNIDAIISEALDHEFVSTMRDELVASRTQRPLRLYHT